MRIEGGDERIQRSQKVRKTVERLDTAPAAAELPPVSSEARAELEAIVDDPSLRSPVPLSDRAGVDPDIVLARAIGRRLYEEWLQGRWDTHE